MRGFISLPYCWKDPGNIGDDELLVIGQGCGLAFVGASDEIRKVAEMACDAELVSIDTFIKLIP
jgi:hypothetical protein